MGLTLKEALEKGIAFHKEGKLQQAEFFYRSILRSDPLHPDANHNLGVLAISLNKIQVALPLLKNALQGNRKVEQFWISYLDALLKDNQVHTAKRVIEDAKTLGLDTERIAIRDEQVSNLGRRENFHNKTLQQQNDTLLKFFQAQKFKEAGNLAVNLTQRFPLQPLGWKILGAILSHYGSNTEAKKRIKEHYY